MKLRMWLMLAALSACNPLVVSPTVDAGPEVAAEDAPDDAPLAPDAAASEDVAVAPVDVARVCLAVGADCRWAANPCCVGYCDFRPEGYSPGSGRCITPLPDGAYCEESRRCASGRCVDEICRARSCAANDGRCASDAECCVGFCTASATSYAPGRCALAQPVGATCDGARWCQSGRCVDGVCAR